MLAYRRYQCEYCKGEVTIQPTRLGVSTSGQEVVGWPGKVVCCCQMSRGAEMALRLDRPEDLLS